MSGGADQEREPELRDAVSAAVRKSAVGQVIGSEDVPLGQSIITSIGGVRGLIESILPSFVFLIVFLVTTDRVPDQQRLLLSTLIPVGVALVFIAVRVLQKVVLTPAITGAVGVAITAALAIFTNRAENNFIPGIVINGVFLLAMLASLVVRRPLIGVFAGILLGERAADWREQRRPRRVLTAATWIWVALFGIRLAVELPLYLMGEAAALALAKLILGVPFYAVVLWATWLLVRSVYPPKDVVEPAATA